MFKQKRSFFTVINVNVASILAYDDNNMLCILCIKTFNVILMSSILSYLVAFCSHYIHLFIKFYLYSSRLQHAISKINKSKQLDAAQRQSPFLVESITLPLPDKEADINKYYGRRTLKTKMASPRYKINGFGYMSPASASPRRIAIYVLCISDAIKSFPTFLNVFASPSIQSGDCGGANAAVTR